MDHDQVTRELGEKWYSPEFPPRRQVFERAMQVYRETAVVCTHSGCLWRIPLTYSRSARKAHKIQGRSL